MRLKFVNALKMLLISMEIFVCLAIYPIIGMPRQKPVKAAQQALSMTSHSALAVSAQLTSHWQLDLDVKHAIRLLITAI